MPILFSRWCLESFGVLQCSIVWRGWNLLFIYAKWVHITMHLWISIYYSRIFFELLPYVSGVYRGFFKYLFTASTSCKHSIIIFNHPMVSVLANTCTVVCWFYDYIHSFCLTSVFPFLGGRFHDIWKLWLSFSKSGLMTDDSALFVDYSYLHYDIFCMLLL